MVVASTLVNTGPHHVPTPQEHTVASADPSMTRAAQREQRAARILDAAGDLLVMWGYSKITIEDVARRAGVGKGTVYLHFPTKEVLFLVVVLRAQKEMTELITETMRREPAGILPSTMARTVYLGVSDSPIINALMTGRTEVLGTLGRTAAEYSEGLVAERIHTSLAYFDALIDHGLLRDDRSADELSYTFAAVLTGFLVTDPLMDQQPALPKPSPTRRAEILTDTVRAALGETGSTDALAAAWPKVTALYEGLARRAQEEVDRYTQTPRDT